MKVFQERITAHGKWSTRFFYALLSIYIILYTGLTLTVIKLPIYPVINRITFFDAVFKWSITDSLQLDMLIASALLSIALFLFYRKYLLVSIASANVVTSLFAYITANSYAQYASGILFISSLPILVSLLLINIRIKMRIQEPLYPIMHHSRFGFDLQEFTAIFFTVLTILDLIVLIRWSTYALFLDGPSQHWSWRLNSLDNNLFYAFGLLSPHLIILSLISFIVRPYLLDIAKKLQRDLLRLHIASSDKDIVASLLLESRITKTWHSVKSFNESLFQSEHKVLILTLVFSVLLSTIFTVYPYAIIPEQNVMLGVDTPFYINTLERISSDPSALLYNIFVEVDGGGRAIPLLGIYITHLVSGESLDVVAKYFPMILGPLLCLAVYFLMRIGYSKSRQLAFLAAIMTALSHQVVIGFYSGFYANWLALVVAFIAAAFLLKSLNGAKKNIAIFGILTSLIIFTHTYTWSYFVIAVAVFLTWSAIRFKKEKRDLKVIIILALVVSITILMDQVRSYSTGFSSLDKDLTIADSNVGLEEFAKRWTNLNTTFRFYVGGLLTNSAILILLFIWTLTADYRHDSDRLLLSMLFVSLLPILFGNHLIQSRILYMVPFQIPASIMMYKIYTRPQASFGKPLFFALLIMQFDYVLRAMANMYLIIPGQFILAVVYQTFLI